MSIGLFFLLRVWRGLFGCLHTVCDCRRGDNIIHEGPSLIRWPHGFPHRAMHKRSRGTCGRDNPSGSRYLGCKCCHPLFGEHQPLLFFRLQTEKIILKIKDIIYLTQIGYCCCIIGAILLCLSLTHLFRRCTEAAHQS